MQVTRCPSPVTVTRYQLQSFEELAASYRQPVTGNWYQEIFQKLQLSQKIVKEKRNRLIITKFAILG